MKQLPVEKIGPKLWLVGGEKVAQVDDWTWTMASRSTDEWRIVTASVDAQEIIRLECDGPCGFWGGRRKTCHHQRLVNAIINYIMTHKNRTSE